MEKLGLKRDVQGDFAHPLSHHVLYCLTNESFFENLRIKMVKIAHYEGNNEHKGNLNKAGPKIEKFLSPIRKVLSFKDSNFNDLNKGFDWCASYVYYIATKVGLMLSPTPLSLNNTLGLVGIWKKWAIKNDFFADSKLIPQSGDIVIFDKLVSENNLDHIGIIIKVIDNYIICSEGNVKNSTGIFKRKIDNKINGYIRLQKKFL